MKMMSHILCAVIIFVSLSMMQESGAFVPCRNSRLRLAAYKNDQRTHTHSQICGRETMVVIQSNNNDNDIQPTGVGRVHDSMTVLKMSKKPSDDVGGGNNKKSFDGILFPPGLIFVAAVAWPVANDPLVVVAIVTAIVALYNLFLMKRDD